MVEQNQDELGESEAGPDGRDEVNIRPSVNALKQYKAAGYKEWWALAEFVDNSISSFELNRQKLKETYGDEYQLVIEIVIDGARDTIGIHDNAAGISANDMQRAFTPGTPPAEGQSGGLSRFGLGMKAAGIWFSDKIEVTTHALGENRTKRVTIDLAEIEASGRETIPPEYFPATARAIGTSVVLSKLSKRIPLDRKPGGALDVIEEYLSSIYRGYLRSNELQLSIEVIRPSGEHEKRLLTFPEIDLLVAPRFDSPDGPATLWRKDIDFQIKIGEKTGRVRGWAGLRKVGSYQNTGLVLVWKGKVIKGASAGRDVREKTDPPYKPSTIFRAANSAISLRLVAEIDVSDFETTTRKDDLTWTTDEEGQFLQDLLNSIDAEPLPLIMQAKGYRVAESQTDVVDQWKDAVTSTGKSVELVPESIVDDFVSQLDQVQIGDLETASLDLENAIEYSYQGDDGGEKIAIQIGFANLPDANRTYILHEFPDDPQRPTLVAINRASRFAVNFLDPRLINPTPFVRVIAALALSELHLTRVAGVPRIGALRRLFNRVLDSDAMTTKPEDL